MSWVKFPDLVKLSQVERSNLNQHITLSLLLLLLMILVSLTRLKLLVLIHSAHQEVLLIALGDSQIKHWDHITGIVLKLSIEHVIELIDVVAVDL